MPLGPRRLASWIDSFVDFTEGLGVPRLFQKWTAVATIAGALERKVWIETDRGKIWPNMYTILVGPAGVGKSLPLNESERLWRSLEDHHCAPTSLSKAAMIDAMSDSTRRVIVGKEYMEFNCLLANISEFGVFLPAYENDFMNVLITFWDGSVYEERRRTKELKIKIERPLLNILAGSTPSYISSLLPEGAWDQGFLSRTILVYAGQAQKVNPFGGRTLDDAGYDVLSHDLRVLGQRVGKLHISSEAQTAITNWYLYDTSAPDHPKLTSYVSRRLVHLLKLCIVFAVDRPNNHVVELQDFIQANDLLTETETAMLDLFRAMRGGGDGQILDELWHFVYTITAKEKKPVAEHRLVNFLSERVPSHNVMKMLEIALKSEMLSVRMSETGLNVYSPGRKT